ncbi:MAG: response regulator [Bryobacterales bacterium]|nr:response regulator [Bryobacterales bacterium]
MEPVRKAVAVLDDLFFTVKILDAAKRAGWEVVFVKEEARLQELAKQSPALILFDLNTKAVDAVAAIQKLKQQPETKSIRLLGFVSHVQVDLKQRALEAGADTVVARSVFSTTLPSIFTRHTETANP